MSQADGSIIIDTKIDQDGLSGGLSKMQSAVKVGVAATVAAIGAMSAAVISLGSEFEMANAAASTLFGDAQVDMTQYQGKMLELSTKTGLAASELGMTMYDALSSGIPASDDMSEALGFLEKNTKLAKAGFTDVNTATTATAKVLNAYKMDVAETDRVHKVLMQTQNLGITTVNELGSVLSQVTPTASAMSVSFEQVGAALAGMTAQGTPTAQATTQLNQLIAELGKSGTQANTAMMDMYEGMGYGRKSFKELMEEGVTLADIIVDMEGYAQDNDKALIDMFGSLEAGKAALSMAGENAKTFTTNLEAMSTSADVVGDAYDKVTDTFKDKSEKVVNSLKNVGISAYSKFEKPLKGAMDSAQLSIENLSSEMSNGKLGKSVDKVADGFGDLISVSIDLASKALPMLVNGFAFVVENGKAITVTLAAIGGGMAAVKVVETVSPWVKSFTSAKAAVEAYNVGLVASTLAGQTFTGSLTLGQIAVGLLTGQITLATAAQSAWNAVQLLSPTTWLVAGVAALAAGIAILTLNSDGSSEALKKQNAELEALKKEQDERISQNEQIREQYDAQMSADLGQVENTKRLADELKGLVDANGQVKEGYESRAAFILDQLNGAMGTEYEMIGTMIDGYNELAGSIDNMLTKMKTEAILKTQKQQYEEAIANQDKYADDVAKSESKLNTIKRENNARIAEIEAEKAEAVNKYGQKRTDQYDSEIAKYQSKIDQAQELYDVDKAQLESCLADKALFEENAQLAQEGRDAEIRTKNQADLEAESGSLLTAYQSRYDQLSIQRDAYIANKNTKDAEQTQKEMDDLVNEGLDKVAQQGINNNEDLNALGGFISAKQAKLANMYLTDKSQWTDAQKQEAIDLQTSIDSGLSTYGTYVESKVNKAKELTSKLTANSTEEQKNAAKQAREQAYDTLGVYAQNVSDKIAKADFLKQELDKGNKNVTKNMVKEAQNQAKEATKEYDKVAANTINALNSKQAESAGIGANYTRGFKNGIESLSDQVTSSANWIAGLAIDALKKTGIVRSPSRKTREIGAFYGEGYALGIEDEEERVIDASNKLGNAAISAIGKTSRKIGDLFQNFDVSKTLEAVKKAILMEQMKMAAVVDTQAKVEVMRTNIMKQDVKIPQLEITDKSTNEIKLVLENGEELAHWLAPALSRELGLMKG